MPKKKIQGIFLYTFTHICIYMNIYTCVYTYMYRFIHTCDAELTLK